MVELLFMRAEAHSDIQHKDASAPKIEADVKPVLQSDAHGTLLREVSASDWRGDLKHVEPSKDASAPRIEGAQSRSDTSNGWPDARSWRDREANRPRGPREGCGERRLA